MAGARRAAVLVEAGWSGRTRAAAAGRPRRAPRAWRARVRAAASALGRHWPLTPAGVALVALAAALLAYGRARMDIVLTLAGLFWLALAGACGLAAAVAGVLLQRDLRRAVAAGTGPRLDGVEGERMPTGLALPRRRVPLAAPATLSWAEPGASVRLEARGAAWRESARPSGRALLPHLVRDTRQEDVLGLWRAHARVVEPRPVRLLPDVGRLTAADLAACLATGDLVSFPYGPPKGDLVDARAYTRSDPARLILWKVYARRRQLLVRAPEQARSPDRQPLVYLVASPGDDAAAGAARLLAESRLLGDGARFAADGTPVPALDGDEALDAICASANHRDRPAADLAAALAHPTVDADDPVVLVLAAARGAWPDDVVAAVRRRPERYVVLAAADAAAPPRRRPRWWRLVVADPRERGANWEELHRVVEPFARCGARVVLADRVSGRLAVLGGDALPREGRTS